MPPPPSSGRSAPATRTPAQATGSLGERLAADHLAAQGCEILDRNWRSGRREIDLVVRSGDTVAFVEVKTRRAGVQAPAEALSFAQRRKIRAAAGAWIGRHPDAAREFRFDLVAVALSPAGEHRITHIPDAFFGDDLG